MTKELNRTRSGDNLQIFCRRPVRRYKRSHVFLKENRKVFLEKITLPKEKHKNLLEELTFFKRILVSPRKHSDFP